MQRQIDLIATLAVIPQTLTDIKCVTLSLLSALSTSSLVKLTPFVQAVYFTSIQFNLFILCVSVHLDDVRHFKAFR